MEEEEQNKIMLEILRSRGKNVKLYLVIYFCNFTVIIMYLRTCI